MRTYFIRNPYWIRSIYPRAQWQVKDGPLWTIDDGPHPESTPRWLDYLDMIQQKGIFFLIGKHAERHPNLVEQIISRGHKIGCHGYHHLNGWKTSTSVYLKDLEHAMSLMDTHLFRPPYGKMTPAQYIRISDQYQIMMWSLMPGDFHPSISIELLTKRLSDIRGHDIIVMHDDPRVTRLLERLFL